jgi:hypothetical protein
VTCNRPTGTAVGNLLVAVYAFEGVANGSGPWIIPNTGQLSTAFIGPSSGWLQACWQTPSATGVGIEVWCAIHGSGATQSAQFAASQNVVTVAAAWSGEYNPTGLISAAPPRIATTAQVTGDQPPAPSVLPNVGELVVACGGDLMGGSGFGTPSGFTNRIDTARSGAGTAEATIADVTASVAGPTGLITFPNTAATSTTRGATATLVFVPAPTTPGVGVVLEAPFAESLDLPDGYIIEWSAIDTTGADVSGVIVSGVSIFGTELGTGTGTDGETPGPYMLVPGPAA